MDILNKAIKKLTDEEYQNLLMEVSGKKKNKPFLVLENARQRELEDSEMMSILQVNPSAYYTLKSRLNTKIAAILSRKVENPIQSIMDEVTRVPAHLFGSNREYSIRALIELEKQLIEYDLNSELNLVYKTLAELHLFSEDYAYYETKFQRHVAFSLAVSKAEITFFQFIRQFGQYMLSMDSQDFEQLTSLKRSLANICELYDSHRLYVIYNIVRIYYICNSPEHRAGLKARELEIEEVISKINQIFEKYPLDTFYQHIKGITDLLYFEYYQNSRNAVRSEHYLQRIMPMLSSMTEKHMMNFFIVQFLRSRVTKFLQDGNLDSLSFRHEKLEKELDIPVSETYHFISLKKYQGIIRFYLRDYAASAKKMNELRNELSMKQYLYTDVDTKLFQALNYCIQGQDSLCLQIISSLKRQIREKDAAFEPAQLMIRILKTALKPSDLRKKIKRISDLWEEFQKVNQHSSWPVLTYVKLDETLIRRISNPIKGN